MPVTTLVRTLLYTFTIACGLVTLAVAAAFIHEVSARFYGYYEPSAAIVAAAAILILTLPVLHFGFHLRRSQTGVISSLAVEVGVLFVLWALFLGGSAATTSDLGAVFRLRACNQYLLCGLGKAMEILAWVTWAGLTLLLFLAIVVGIKTATWSRPLDETVRGGNLADRPALPSSGRTTTSSVQGRSEEMTSV
ncbi:hypothetical protein JCM11491_000147 [Sporobolomyces phaffii]